MSKPSPKKSGRLWETDKRNAQLPLTRRCSVHPAPEPEKKPALAPEPETDVTQVTPPTHARRRKARKSVRLKLHRGQPCAGSKLTRGLSKQLCELIEQQMTLEDACTIVGINRKTVWEWRAKGQNGENPAYVAFEAKISEALIRAKHTLITGIATDRDIRGKIFLLKNRYPAEYRDRVVQEMTGTEGAPLFPPEQHFNVVLELASPDGIEPQFRVVQPCEVSRQDRASQGGELSQQSNGELPPRWQ